MINKTAVRSDHLHFSAEIKKRWIVKRDECYDEYIVLNGKRAIGKYGLDHIYLIGVSKAGLWITAPQIKCKIKALLKNIPSLIIELLGDGEAVVSVPINDLHALCEVARARKRKQLSEERLKQLRENCPFNKQAEGYL